MKGMWTKHFSTDGLKTYYYNSARNLSVWTPPADAVIHEAINAKPPVRVEEQLKNQEALSLFSDAVEKIEYHPEIDQKQMPTSTVVPDEQISLHDRLQQATAKKQQLALKRNRNSESDGRVDDSKKSAYLQQKSALEAMQGGGGGDDSSKWLVR